MPEISPEKLAAFRAQTYRTRPGTKLKTLDQAVAFVNERGFVFFWPIKGVELPSLWVAAAGDRPVPNEHDDPGHVTWGWKDDALGKRRWYYGRLLRHRNMMVSLECLPYFYALSPNFGDPENDYLEQYRQGTITLEAKLLYEALLKKGAMDTLSLRREARLSSPGSETRFNRALDSLQGELKILPVGISQAGTWHYAFIYASSPAISRTCRSRRAPFRNPKPAAIFCTPTCNPSGLPASPKQAGFSAGGPRRSKKPSPGWSHRTWPARTAR